MLDERTKLMVDVAAELSAEDIEFLKAGVISNPAISRDAVSVGPMESGAGAVAMLRRPSTSTSAGDYERRRTRESKISTACIGNERVKHSWWPIGTQLVARIGSEEFTADVVENARVKSGRSILLTSGAADGRLCITPTRAALVATEDYRQTNGLGRGGGVTNGWLFWQPRTGATV